MKEYFELRKNFDFSLEGGMLIPTLKSQDNRVLKMRKLVVLLP